MRNVFFCWIAGVCQSFFLCFRNEYPDFICSYSMIVLEVAGTAFLPLHVDKKVQSSCIGANPHYNDLCKLCFLNLLE